MPVLLVGVDGHTVPHTDSLRAGTPSLYPADALDDVQQLPAGVGVPVITNAGLEPNDRHRR
jgi:hypothetical protein